MIRNLRTNQHQTKPNHQIPSKHNQPTLNPPTSKQRPHKTHKTEVTGNYHPKPKPTQNKNPHETTKLHKPPTKGGKPEKLPVPDNTHQTTNPNQNTPAVKQTPTPPQIATKATTFHHNRQHAANITISKANHTLQIRTLNSQPITYITSPRNRNLRRRPKTHNNNQPTHQPSNHHRYPTANPQQNHHKLNHHPQTQTQQNTLTRNQQSTEIQPRRYIIPTPRRANKPSKPKHQSSHTKPP